MNDILQLSLSEVSSLIKKSEVSPVEVTRQAINEMKENNQDTNIFITICEESALEAARCAENEIRNGVYKGPLHGVPLSMKDNISVQNIRCTSGSILYKDHMSEEDALVVQKLRSAGAIITGKTNLDEFANHVTGINKHYGTIKNPVHANHMVGGSSGGSAASVAANLAYASLGTDTSGSVRIPASCCGVVGLKPTFNLIPTLGVSPLSWSMDHLGILTKNCEDLSSVFHSIVPGMKKGPLQLENRLELADLTLGIPEGYFFELMDTEVEARVRGVIKELSANGVTVKYVKVDKRRIERAMEAQEIIIGAEAAYYHEKHLSDHKAFLEEDNVLFLEEALHISQSEYREALQIKEEMTRELASLVSEGEILVTPTLPVTPPKTSDEKVRWGNDEEDILNTFSRFTGPFNISGLPALSIPIGVSKEKLPIGMQMIGSMYSENELIAVGNYISKMIS